MMYLTEKLDVTLWVDPAMSEVESKALHVAGLSLGFHILAGYIYVYTYMYIYVRARQQCFAEALKLKAEELNLVWGADFKPARTMLIQVAERIPQYTRCANGPKP